MDENKKAAGGAIEIQSYLEDLDYPATKQDIIDKANENDAPDEVMDKLDRMAEREYAGPTEVSKEFAQAK